MRFSTVLRCTQNYDPKVLNSSIRHPLPPSAPIVTIPIPALHLPCQHRDLRHRVVNGSLPPALEALGHSTTGAWNKRGCRRVVLRAQPNFHTQHERQPTALLKLLEEPLEAPCWGIKASERYRRTNGALFLRHHTTTCPAKGDRNAFPSVASLFLPLSLICSDVSISVSPRGSL